MLTRHHDKKRLDMCKLCDSMCESAAFTGNRAMGRTIRGGNSMSNADVENTTATVGTDVIFEARNLRKHFGGIRAVDGVSLKLFRNEIVGIVGDNGAGKSTLIKLISGVYRPDDGEMFLDGEDYVIQNAKDAKRLGVETVHQNRGLVEVLNAPANMFLGRERVQPGIAGSVFRLLDKKYMRQETDDALKRLQIRLRNMNSPVRVLSGGQQQSVSVGRAAYWKGKLVILDEPANNLGVEEQEKVLHVIRELRSGSNITFILISHNLEHVFDVSDRIIVMRNGMIAGERLTRDTTRNEIVSLITGLSH